MLYLLLSSVLIAKASFFDRDPSCSLSQLASPSLRDLCDLLFKNLSSRSLVALLLAWPNRHTARHPKNGHSSLGVMNFLLPFEISVISCLKICLRALLSLSC